jgi:hypothetical protein
VAGRSGDMVSTPSRPQQGDASPDPPEEQM